MGLYRYEALNEKGKTVTSTLDAESLQDAKQKLIRRHVFVTRVSAIEKKKGGVALKKKETLLLTRELTRLLRAGLPLYESLQALEEKYRGGKPQELLLDLCDKIRTGQLFSSALAEHPLTFDVMYCSMISNAENSGTLPKALDELAQLIDRQLSVQKQVVGALLYPTLLASFCLLVLSTLLFFVIPSLFDLFEGRTLHSFTRFVFACSHGAIKAKWVLASLLALLVSAIGWSFLSRKGRSVSRRALIRMPALSSLLAKVALTRFFRATATLLEGGLPALFALEQAKGTLNHAPLEQSIQHAIRRLGEGETLQASLAGQPYIPALIPRMIGIAEEAGNLSGMMQQISLIYEEDLEKVFSQITALAQPILLLVLGAMVGFVLLSVLLPLSDISAFTT